MSKYDHWPTTSMGPEMKILRDELKRQSQKMAYQSGFEDQVIWAINSLEKTLVKYNYEVRTTYHKDWRGTNAAKNYENKQKEVNK
jgi:hypothetical protein|tara:strand:- start:163 stop:417 length:255 start_codon:yes stop_codon:yes gene_type:complete